MVTVNGTTLTQGIGVAGTPAGGVSTVQGDPAGTPVPISGAVSGTVTADQGARGTEAWPQKAAPPLAFVTLIDTQVLPAANAWVTSVAVAIQNGANDQGYDGVRFGMNLTVPAAAGNLVEVYSEVSLNGGATWQEVEESVDITPLPAGGIQLTPSYARHRTLELPAAGTASRTWTIAVHGCTHYRVNIREAVASPGVTQATAFVEATQFKG